LGIGIKITNGTIPLDVSIEDPFTSFISTLLIPLISIVVVSLIGLFTWKYSKKQYERNAINDIFNMLDSPENKEAEDLLIKSQGNYNAEEFLPDNYDQAITTIRRNYYKIRLMIDEGLVPPKPIYLTYGHKLVQLYDICRPQIEKIRKNNASHYASYFTNLAIDCLNYYFDKNELEPVKNTKGIEISKGSFGSKIPPFKKR
jgi:hypothetical protein